MLECFAGWGPALSDAFAMDGGQIQAPHGICQTLNPGSTEQLCRQYHAVAL